MVDRSFFAQCHAVHVVLSSAPLTGFLSSAAFHCEFKNDHR